MHDAADDMAAAVSPGDRAAGVDASQRLVAQRRATPCTNHHGTPFIAGSTIVCGPSSGPIACATAGRAGALTAMTTRSCGPSACASSLATVGVATQRAALLEAPAVRAQRRQRLAAREGAHLGDAGGGEPRADEAADRAGADDADLHPLSPSPLRRLE